MRLGEAKGLRLENLKRSKNKFHAIFQVIKNEPYDDHPLLNGKFTKGQYTYKIYRLESKVSKDMYNLHANYQLSSGQWTCIFMTKEVTLTMIRCPVGSLSLIHISEPTRPY